MPLRVYFSRFAIVVLSIVKYALTVDFMYKNRKAGIAINNTSVIILILLFICFIVKYNNNARIKHIKITIPVYDCNMNKK